jgi:nitrate/nitrite transporter NarK
VPKPEQDYFPAFLILFLVIFAACGIGNGSTFRTIGVIFSQELKGPVLGWTSAVAAYGAFIAPRVMGEQIEAGSPEIAMYAFACLLCHLPGSELVVLSSPERLHQESLVMRDTMRSDTRNAMRTGLRTTDMPDGQCGLQGVKA